MSVRWNGEDVYEWELLQSDEKEVFKTDDVIEHGALFALGGITKANHEKWYERYLMIRRALGARVVLSLDDVKRRIGLWVGGGTTDAKHRKLIYRLIQESVQDRIRYEKGGE